MKRRRKTAAERRQEYADAEERVWRTFSAKLNKAGTAAEVAELAFGSAPAQGEPGRKFYSNLAFFVGHGFSIVPDGSNNTERAHYGKLVQRLRDAGELK